jgi:hypothetical protein
MAVNHLRSVLAPPAASSRLRTVWFSLTLLFALDLYMHFGQTFATLCAFYRAGCFPAMGVTL